MTRFERENLKVRLIKLIALKCTGSPAELAFMLGVSERTIKRFIKELREDGYDIWFCQLRGSYVNGLDYY